VQLLYLLRHLIERNLLLEQLKGETINVRILLALSFLVFLESVLKIGALILVLSYKEQVVYLNI
jgi:hypothetical protein